VRRKIPLFPPFVKGEEGGFNQLNETNEKNAAVERIIHPHPDPLPKIGRGSSPSQLPPPTGGGEQRKRVSIERGRLRK
jgi:hypothetical protein